MTQDEISFINEAAQYFSNPGGVIKGLNWLGDKIDGAQKLLPQKVQTKIAKVVSYTLKHALATTLRTIPSKTVDVALLTAKSSSRKKGYAHSALTTIAGGVAGFFGLEAAILEIPLSTLLMMRSIAETGREFGEDMSTPESALQCLVVLSLGGKTSTEEISETAYYATRTSLAGGVSAAAAFIGSSNSKAIRLAIKNDTAPAIVRMIAKVASVFEIRVTKKLLSQAIPVIGGVGGAALNATFTEFYNRSARYHFGIRKLERLYGEETVRAQFVAATPAPKALPPSI